MALFLTFAVIGHVTMPTIGFNAVATALSMEGTFKEPAAMGRAITTPALVWKLFWLIAAAEAIAAALCWLGVLNLALRLGDAAAFNQAKRFGLWGLGLTALLYIAGFHAIAGEWFLMWQNSQINVLPDAFRNAATALLLMLLIGQEDR
jgi:predicted small integral membrane protein